MRLPSLDKFPSLDIRTRLALWYAAALAAIILIFAVVVYYVLRADLMGQLRTEAGQNVARVETLLREEPGELEELEELEEYGSVRFYRVSGGGAPVYRSAAWMQAGLDRALPLRGDAGGQVWETPGDVHFFVHAASLDVQGRTFRVVTAEEADGVFRSLQSLLSILLVGVPCALLLAALGGYLLAGRLLAPVHRMATKARRITAERLSERLPVGNPDDELGRLATAFNRALERLEDAFARLRQFTADASHELRTPLTSLRSVGEVALQKPDGRPPAFYRGVIGSMLEEADRLHRLVADLLTLTRSDIGTLRKARAPVDLAALCRDVRDQLGVLAEEKGQHLTLEADSAMAEGDPETLRLVLTNLLDNAIKYTPDGGRIAVRAGRGKEGQVFVEVQDEGPGIASEHQARVFERFYRVDEGRSREAGGSGLGLAIAERAARLNGGRLQLESTPGQGSCFRLVLPTSPSTSDAPSLSSQQPRTHPKGDKP